MKEHDEIDELFRNGLEEFHPDATHLHYAPIANVVASKTVAAAAKVGFWTKFGLPLLLGTTITSGAVVTVALTDDQEVSLKTAIHHVKPVSTELTEEMTEELTVGTNNDQQPYYGSMSVDKALANQIYSEQTEQIRQSRELANINTFAQSSDRNQKQQNDRAGKPVVNVATKKAKNGNFELISTEKTTIAEAPKTVIARFIGSNIQGAEGLESVPVYRKKGRTPANGYMQKHAPLATYFAATQKTDSSSLLTSSLEADSSDQSALRVIMRPQPVWPKRELNLRVGLAYVPLQQESQLYSSLPDSIDPFFWGAYDMVKRPSTKNEFLLSLGYQKQLANKLEIGAGFMMSQGGWRAYDDLVTHYWIDNQDGTFTFFHDTTTVGEWDISYRSYGVNLSLGYHFPLGDKLAFGVNGGIAGSQVLVDNKYRYYETNGITSTKNTRFSISLFALGEFTYRIGPIGISAGVNLNGRSEFSRVFNASGFYNNVSFGVHTGIHYYLPELRR